MMVQCLKKIRACGLLCAVVCVCAAVSEPAHGVPAFLDAQGPFALSLPLDASIAAAGVALNAGYIVVSKGIQWKDDVFDGSPLFRQDVNPFDRWAMNPYSKALDAAGSVTLGAAAAAPFLLFVTPKTEWFSIGVMYAEAQLFANGMKNLVKAFVRRPRPYMYFDGAPGGKIADGDWCASFPSGHTTAAFAGASFLSFVFCAYFPDSPYRIPVVAASGALAVGTAALRILSGNHFLSDVLVGAAIGTISGIVVPLAHIPAAGRKRARLRSGGACLEVSPSGVLFTGAC
ncbi:MAG: phosphatase PAP2 family protein [Treponemataceae bacterium]|nr:phosphatase PAP2 family protein [Treponemataceae bacterium]